MPVSHVRWNPETNFGKLFGGTPSTDTASQETGQDKGPGLTFLRKKHHGQFGGDDYKQMNN